MWSTHDSPVHPLNPTARSIAALWFERDDLEGEEWPDPVGLLIGEQPKPGGNPKLPLWPYPPGCAGARLFEMSKMDMLEYFQLLARVNVSRNLVARWNANWARERGISLIASVPEETRVVACGAKARDALGLDDFFRHRWITREDGSKIECVAIPHPSGRCREYNDPDNVKLASGWIRWAARLR